MKMTLFKQGMLLMALLGGVSSCINDDVPAGTHEVGKDDPDGNVVFEMIVPNNTGTLTKAETTETSGMYETGNVKEYELHNVTVYLFDSQTGAFCQSFYLDNLSMINPQKGGSQDNTQYATSNQSEHQVCYQSKTLKVNEEGTYNIYAVANKTYKRPADETEFLNAIDKETYREGFISGIPDGGFVMTTRADNSGLYSLNYTGKNRKVQLVKTSTTSEPTRVKLILERTVAKVLVGRSRDVFPLYKPGQNDSPYATLELSDYSPINLSTWFYRHRHVANFPSFPTLIPETVTDNFGEVEGNDGYVVDPYFLNKTGEGAANFDNPDEYYEYQLGRKWKWNKVNTVNEDLNKSSFSYFYCLENCMFHTAQKNAYSTGVHFRASLTPAAYTTEDGTVPSTKSTVIYYANYTFFDSWNALKKHIDVPASVAATSSDEDLASIGIKRFTRTEATEPFYCYYNYWIRHLDNNDEFNMGVMEFAIVRNNIYRLWVSKINDLGSSSPEIDPGQDDEYGVKLEISFCVLPWIVRNQGGEGGVIL